MSKTRKYATNWLEQPLYVFMNVTLLFIINVSKLRRARSYCNGMMAMTLLINLAYYGH